LRLPVLGYCYYFAILNLASKNRPHLPLARNLTNFQAIVFGVKDHPALFLFDKIHLFDYNLFDYNQKQVFSDRSVEDGL